MAKSKQDQSQSTELEIQEKLVSIRRVAKVVKGGRRFGFAALVVAGDGKGSVGYGSGKAKEVMDARSKASQAAKKSLVRIPLKEGRTLHHDVKGRFGAGTIIMRSAPPGTGIIAGGPLRSVFECLGVQDVVAKSIGTSNPHNMVKACFEALQTMQSPKRVASRRGKKVGEIIVRRDTNVKGSHHEHQEES